MADYTEFQTVVLDVTGVTEVKALEQAVVAEEQAVVRAAATHKKVAADIYDFADCYEVVGAELEKIVAIAPKAEKAFNWSTIVNPKVRQLTEDFDFATIKLAKSVNGVEQSTSRAAGAFSKYQQQIIAGSYAFQDFTATSGDLGAKLNSITNNIPQLLVGLGGIGQAISLAATAGVALYRNWDSVTALFETRHPFPRTANDLDRMREKLGDVSKELAKLKAQGTVNDEGLGRVRELQKEEESLKNAIKVRDQVNSLKQQRTTAEEQVAAAFKSAIKESGAAKALEAMEQDLSSSANPILKNLFTDIFKKIEDGNLDAYRALLDHAKASPDKYGALAKEMEEALKKSWGQSGTDKPMDGAVKFMRELQDRQIEQLTRQGAAIEQEMVDGMTKQAKEGVLSLVADPLEALAIKSRAMGVDVKKETAYLKDAAEAEAARLFPEIQKMFPEAFAGVVKGIVTAVKESVDRTIEQLQAVEGLTKQEAIRRLNQERLGKNESNAENLAADEFTQAAGRNLSREAAMTGGPRPTMAQAQAAGREFQGQLQNAGVSARGQVAIGKAMNQRGGEEAIAQAMEVMQAFGLDDDLALQLLPEVLQLMQSGKQAFQAVEQVLRRREQGERRAMNAAAVQASRPASKFGRARGGQAQPQQAQGAGFKSVPVGPGTGGIEQTAQGLVQANGALAARVEAVEQILGQALTAIQAQNGRGANQLRRAVQDGDSYLPTVW